MKIKSTEFAKRRRALMHAMDKGSIAILPAADEKIRNRDAEYPYRQDSDFLYLTGFNEPSAVLVLIPGRKDGEVVLFCRERDKTMETWHGRRAGQEGAIAAHGADDAFPIDDIDEILPGLLENKTAIYYTLGQHGEFDATVIAWLNQFKATSRGTTQHPHEFIDLNFLLHEMRLFKSKMEIKLMKHSSKIAANAHQHAMSVVKPGMFEYELEAEYLYHFRKNGCVPAYNSIVGGGENGCILHYVENTEELNDGDLVLVDAGAEYQGYASDISRTYPVNGRFTAAQRALYDIVLKAQLAAIDVAKPGNHWNDPHDAAVRVLTRGLIKLGLIKSTPAKAIKNNDYAPFYMHRTGHWIGLDVHDVGEYRIDGHSRLLEPGMVLTIEPGLYISPDIKGVHKKWKNIGIRIEDNILITKTGNEVITDHVIKDPDDIERWMSA